MSDVNTSWDYVTNEIEYESPEDDNVGYSTYGDHHMNSGEHAWFDVSPNGFVVAVSDHYELKADCWQIDREAMKVLAEAMLKAYESHPGTKQVASTTT